MKLNCRANPKPRQTMELFPRIRISYVLLVQIRSNPQTLAPGIKFSLLLTVPPEHVPQQCALSCALDSLGRMRSSFNIYPRPLPFLKHFFKKRIKVIIIILQQVSIIGGLNNYPEPHSCHIYIFLSSIFINTPLFVNNRVHYHFPSLKRINIILFINIFPQCSQPLGLSCKMAHPFGECTLI